MKVTAESAQKIHRAMGWFVFSCLFIFFTSFLEEGQIVFEEENIVIPFMDTEISRALFLSFGPILIVLFNLYIFVISNNLHFRQIAPSRDDYIFISRRAPAIFTTIFIFYMLGPFALGALFLQYRHLEQSAILLTSFVILVSVSINLLIWRFINGKYLPRNRSAMPLAFLILAGLLLWWLESFFEDAGSYHDLFRANLERVDLNGIRLPEAIISESNLLGASFRDAYLVRTDFGASCMNYTDLTGARMDNAIFRSSNLVRARLRGANLPGASFYKAQMTRANLSNADLTDACLYKSVLNNASLRGADLANANLYRAVLNGEPFDDRTNLSDAFMIGVTGLDCDALKVANGWELAHRDVELLCGEPLPSNQPPTSRLQNCQAIPENILADSETFREEFEERHGWDLFNYNNAQQISQEKIEFVIDEFGENYSFKRNNREIGEEMEDFLSPNYLVEICTDSGDLNSLLGLAAGRSASEESNGR